ncbi:MAG TPA: hypothetical protein VIP98_01550 [Microlunatus sp.]
MRMQPVKPSGFHSELVDRILGPKAHAPLPWRRAAFDNTGPEDVRVRALVEKVATAPTEVIDADFERVSDAGLSDDQAWEIAICAAVGQATRQYESGLQALAAALDEEAQE